MRPCRYGWHFPEMTKITSDNIQFAKAVKLMGMRDAAASTDFSGWCLVFWTGNSDLYLCITRVPGQSGSGHCSIEPPVTVPLGPQRFCLPLPFLRSAQLLDAVYSHLYILGQAAGHSTIDQDVHIAC